MPRAISVGHRFPGLRTTAVSLSFSPFMPLFLSALELVVGPNHGGLPVARRQELVAFGVFGCALGH